MERKYRNTKKALVVLSVIIVLVIGTFVWGIVTIPNAQTKAEEKVLAELEEKTAEYEQIKNDYENGTLKDDASALKEKRDDLKKYQRDLVKAYTKGGDVQAVIDEYEGTGEE